MVEQHYGDFNINDALLSSLENFLAGHTLPEHAEQLVLNCRQTSYYRPRQGLHPIGIQLKRELISAP